MRLQLRVMHPEGDVAEGGSPVPAPAAQPDATQPPSQVETPAPAPAAPTEGVSARFGQSDYNDSPTVADEDLDIFQPQDDLPVVQAQEEIPAPKPAPKEDPATPPAATPKEPPAVEAPAPASPPAPSSPTPPAASVAPTESPEQAGARLQAVRDAWRTETLAKAKAAYEPIIAAHASELLTNPEKVLPELAAQLFVDATEAAMAQVASMMPQAIHNYQQGRQIYERGEQEAAAAWPEIFQGPDANARKEIFKQHAWNFRKMAPAAPAADIIQKAGAATLVQLNLSRGTPASPATPVSPAAPATGFRPGGAGARTGLAPATPKSDNVFTNLAEEFLQDDQS